MTTILPLSSLSDLSESLASAARPRATVPSAPGRLAALLDLQAQIAREAADARAAGGPARGVMTWLLDRRNLAAAWDRVSGADGAETPGADGVTCRDVWRAAGGPGRWVADLADDLYRRRYRPGAVRWVDVPKPGRPGETRRLGILTIRDRVVHAAVKQVLEPVLEPLFVPHSFGFRPGRSVAGALERACGLLSGRRAGPADPGGNAAAPGAAEATASVPAAEPEAAPFAWAVRLDVADCFDTIDHARLLAGLAEYVADDDALELVAGLLAAAGTGRAGVLWRWRRRRGVVQGSALSPLLCNLYLHPLDRALAALGRRTGGGVRALRYADDLLVLARDEALAREAVACARRALADGCQRVKDAKTAARPVADGVEWLGAVLRPRPHYRQWTGKVRYGYAVPDDKVVAMLARLADVGADPAPLHEASDASRDREGAVRLDHPTPLPDGRGSHDVPGDPAFGAGVVRPAVRRMNARLQEYYQAYVYADNAGYVFRALDDAARRRIEDLLRSATGLARRDVGTRFRVRLPRSFWTWEVAGERLVVLSSRPPRRPRGLTRPPPWHHPAAHETPAPPMPATRPDPSAPPATATNGPPDRADASIAAPIPPP